MSEVRAIEDATRAALIAEEQEFDGWWLRCNPELPNRRPNSATTPLRGSIDPAAIEHVVDWYVSRCRPPIVRILSVSDPALDDALGERGWSFESPTLVMVGLLGDRHESIDARVVEAADGVPHEFSSFRSRLGLGATAAQLVHGRRDLSSIYAVAPATGDVVATGRAVLVADRAGLYDVVTLPELRRRGWGSRVVRRLLAAADDSGVTTAFLQVEADNVAAIGMYEALGFETLYRYHYRRPPVD